MKEWLPSEWQFSCCAAAALVAIGPVGSAVTAKPATAWLTGRALQAKLAEPVDVYWSETPLRQAVESLSRVHRAAALIDRRVDPGQSLDLKLNGQPLRQVFQQIAASRGLGVSWLGPVAYIGPSRVTSRVRTLAELRRQEVHALSSGAGRKLLSPKRIQWDDLATPRELLAQLAAQSGIEISGLDQVPHDLWAAADLPSLSLVDRLTLIAGQFDLTFQVALDGKSIALIPLPDDVAIQRSYPGGRQPRQLAEKWAALVPDSQIKVVGNKIRVRGLLEDHDRIAESLRPPGPRTSRPVRKGQGKDLFTGRLAGPLGELLEALAARFQLRLRIDHEALKQAGISLEQPVSVNVKDATIEQLLGALCAEAGCTFRRKGNVIEVRPAE